MLSPSATAEQLRAARLRIASLEHELAILRSATPSPTPQPPSPLSLIRKPARSPTVAHPLKLRPSVMTRRASAAAAAAAAAVTAVASDLVAPLPRKVHIAPKPIEAGLLVGMEEEEEDGIMMSLGGCAEGVPPECSEVSAGASEHSSSMAVSAKAEDQAMEEQEMEEQEQEEQGQEEEGFVGEETPVDELESAPASENGGAGSRALSPDCVTQAVEAVTPELDVGHFGEAGVKFVSLDQRVGLSAPVEGDKIVVVPAGSPVLSDSPEGKQGGEEPGKRSEEAGSGSGVARRRPPPLPLVKTSSTKKERVSVVAKCTEPRPGQTRYWTEEEHERFLVAVAEYGEKAYVAISNYVETRTPKQVRTHAQKFQMKMARQASKSIEAGEPVQMPAGMNPVVQVSNSEGKPSLMPLPTGAQSCELPALAVKGLPGHVPVVITTMAPPAKVLAEKKPSAVTITDGSMKMGGGGVKKDGACGVVTDESSSQLTDPYLDYIGGTADAKGDMELENSFAAKLCQNLEPVVGDGEVKEEKFLIADEGEVKGMHHEDDDLEDLEKLEDGDLTLAAFTSTTEGWLLPDAAA